MAVGGARVYGISRKKPGFGVRSLSASVSVTFAAYASVVVAAVASTSAFAGDAAA